MACEPSPRQRRRTLPVEAATPGPDTGEFQLVFRKGGLTAGFIVLEDSRRSQCCQGVGALWGPARGREHGGSRGQRGLEPHSARLCSRAAVLGPSSECPPDPE